MIDGDEVMIHSVRTSIKQTLTADAGGLGLELEQSGDKDKRGPLEDPRRAAGPGAGRDAGPRDRTDVLLGASTPGPELPQRPVSYVAPGELAVSVHDLP